MLIGQGLCPSPRGCGTGSSSDHGDRAWEEAVYKDAVAKTRENKGWADESIRKPRRAYGFHKTPRNYDRIEGCCRVKELEMHR